MSDQQPAPTPCWARQILDRVRTTESTTTPSSSYPSIKSIPLITSHRLNSPDASPSPLPTEPIPSTSLPPPVSPSPGAPKAAPSTILYLAYGSNLSAKTFLGTRGIRPLSQINVSAPSLRLVFDLPGLPYVEPCFANTAIRKLPKPPFPVPEPPKLPPGMPRPPAYSAKDETTKGGRRETTTMPGDAVWEKGLIGVVYEVTKEDYAKIIATEGGGAGYADIVVPCIPLPPRMGVPEKPDWPQLPGVFVAHTLYAPQIPGKPGVPGEDGEGHKGETGEGEAGEGEQKKVGTGGGRGYKPVQTNGKGSQDDAIGGGDDDSDDGKWKLPPWARDLLLPVRRPIDGYAQPSARYLKLIRDGAREHELPDEYQAYLHRLKPYSITRPSQSVGMVLLVLVFGVPFLLGVFGGRLFADKEGKVPRWVAVYMAVLLNVVWGAYDRVWKGAFGDGERTEEVDDEVMMGKRERRGSLLLGGKRDVDEEKSLLRG